LGIAAVFQPGTPMRAIIDFIEHNVRPEPTTSK